MYKQITLIDMTHQFGGRVVTNEEIESKYNLPLGWILEKTGKKRGHAWAENENPATISAECLKRLLGSNNIPLEKINAVFGTTNIITLDGNTETESLTKQFATKVGFGEGVYITDESFGCGGPIMGVQVMKKWFDNRSDKDSYAVYVTQDWSTRMVRDRNVEALFSDAVSVSIWSNSQNGELVLGDIFATESTIEDESLGIFNGYWKMNGRDVSEKATEIPILVAKELGIDLQDFDLVPHQPNPKLLETMEKRHGIVLYKKVAIEHGNPTCSGSFIALEERIKERQQANSAVLGKDIVVMPFGAGGMGGFILSYANGGGLLK